MQLYRSDTLMHLAFYAPDLPERAAGLSRQQLEVLHDRTFIEVQSSDSDSVTITCLPEMRSNLQSRFCDIPNYIPRGPLTRLAGGNSDDIECRLPDGSVVDVTALQKWLNESVATGWRVGVSRVFGTKGPREIVALRQRDEQGNKPQGARTATPK